MLVRDIMKKGVVTVAPDASLQDAYALMQERRFRHLPVVEGGRLVGIVTDRDLRFATSSLSPRPFRPESKVADVMNRDPKTADPMDPVEDAARIMREFKIGCLPVLDGDGLLGIITGIDLLDALLRLTGVDKPSSRIEVELQDRPGEICKLTRFFSERGVNIHSILTYPEGPDNVRTVLRVDTIESRQLADLLRKENCRVIWPPSKPWSR